MFGWNMALNILTLRLTVNAVRAPSERRQSAGRAQAELFSTASSGKESLRVPMAPNMSSISVCVFSTGISGITRITRITRITAIIAIIYFGQKNMSQRNGGSVKSSSVLVVEVVEIDKSWMQWAISHVKSTLISVAVSTWEPITFKALHTRAKKLLFVRHFHY